MGRVRKGSKIPAKPFTASGRTSAPGRLPVIRRPLGWTIVAALLALPATGRSQGILDPHGPVAAAEQSILFDSVAIMLCIVIPVIVTTLVVAWWFRASNTKARYLPTWAYSGRIEIVIWSIPAMVILLLGGIAWIGSHELDPARPIPSDTPTIEVDVVALDWKWLFIYPEQGVASVNRLVVPTGTPVLLKITSATVMNSFFVPQLGSQIYAMAGMTTQLNLLADREGRYPGLSAQFSGDGFSGMRFAVDAVPQAQFAAWVAGARAANAPLDTQSYAALFRPSKYVAPRTYSAVDPELFGEIVAMRVSSLGPSLPGNQSPAAVPHGAHNEGH